MVRRKEEVEWFPNKEAAESFVESLMGDGEHRNLLDIPQVLPPHPDRPDDTRWAVVWAVDV